MTLERRIQFFSTETKDLQAGGTIVAPGVIHNFLAGLVPANDWQKSITPSLACGLVSAVRSSNLEGAFFYDKLDNFPTIGRGVNAALLQLAQGETLREVAHFVWYDMTRFRAAFGINAPTQGLLAIEYAHAGPKAEKLGEFIFAKSNQRYATEIIALNEPGALHRIAGATHIKSLKVKEYDPNILPGVGGLEGLLLPADLSGVHEVKYEIKPHRGGLFGINPKFKKDLGSFRQHPNIEIRVVFDDGIELPLEQANMVVYTTEVKRAAPKAKSVDPDSMLSEIRAAFNTKKPLLSRFFHRDIK